MAQCDMGTPWAGPVRFCQCRASTCPHIYSLSAFGNAFAFDGLQEGVGRGGGYHHLFPRISKLIAFDFAAPPPTGATCCDLAAMLCRNTYSPLSLLACVITRSGIDLVFTYGVMILKPIFSIVAVPLLVGAASLVGNPSSSWRLAWL